MNFVFYDTETTGTDTTFDQILQFAAVLTNEKLDEIDRFETRCRLLPHIIPAPGALLATGIRPETLVDRNLPTHYEAMREVGRKLREWSPSVFIGYNTLAFDEPLLRQTFFQTLQPVFLTNSNGNQRADVLRLAQVAAALSPNSLVVPLSDRGKPTLRLDKLAPANGFSHENAHDALGDVEATIHIARLIRERASSIWQSMMPLADKRVVQTRLASKSPLSLVEYHMGVPSIYPVVGCGHHPMNPNMQAVLDLNRDPERILRMTGDELFSEMAGPNRALRTVFSNRMPALLDIGHASDLPSAIDLGAETIARRAAMVSDDKEFAVRVGSAMEQRYPPFEPAQLVEQRLYERFPNSSDQKRMQDFHLGGWTGRAEIAESFDDDRLRELARRLVFFDAPEALSERQRANLSHWLINRRHGRENVEAGRTVKAALEELDKLSSERGECEAIAEIRSWFAGFEKPNR
ncbi:exonuclease domain-containing protein [Yoonia sp. R2-816]|uniref:exonuclease domain-containing protein n=1 Tax=Yoonia sp. R2-816 TaxID=3342638 RepID=UPI0037286619